MGEDMGVGDTTLQSAFLEIYDTYMDVWIFTLDYFELMTLSLFTFHSNIFSVEK